MVRCQPDQTNAPQRILNNNFSLEINANGQNVRIAGSGGALEVDAVQGYSSVVEGSEKCPKNTISQHSCLDLTDPTPLVCEPPSPAPALLEDAELLEPAHARFVDALLRSPTLDRTAAARVAWNLEPGTSEWDNANARGWRTFNLPAVQAEIKRRQRYIAEATTDAQALQLDTAMARIAFADPRQLAGRDLADLPDDIAMALAGVKIKKTTFTSKDGAETVTDEHEYKLADRHQAIQGLYRRRGLIKDDQASGVSIRFDLHL